MSSDLNERAIAGAHVLAGPRELRRRRDGVVNGEELPGLVDTAQTMRPAIGELQARACDEIPHSSGGENFAPTCGCRDPCADVDRQATQLVADPLTFSRVHAGSNLEAEVTHRPDDRARAADSHSRAVEAGKESVACGVELTSVEPGEQLADARIVLVDQLVPAAVSELAGALRRADNVSEENRRKQTVLRLRG